jgi:cell division protein ZapA
MRNDEQTPIAVKILDKDYQVNCSEEEREPLIASARLLDKKMRSIRESRKVVGTDRIAVMAALNIAHELIMCQSNVDTTDAKSSGKLKDINAKLQKALARHGYAESA